MDLMDLSTFKIFLIMPNVLIITPDTSQNEQPVAFGSEKENGRLIVLSLIRAVHVPWSPERNHTYWFSILQT